MVSAIADRSDGPISVRTVQRPNQAFIVRVPFSGSSRNCQPRYLEGHCPASSCWYCDCVSLANGLSRSHLVGSCSRASDMSGFSHAAPATFLVFFIASCDAVRDGGYVSSRVEADVCRSTVQFHHSLDADGFVAQQADSLVAMVRSGELVVDRNGDQIVFYTNKFNLGECDVSGISQVVASHSSQNSTAINLSLEMSTGQAVGEVVSRGYDQHEDERAPRGCVTVFRLDQDQMSVSAAIHLGDLGLNLVRFSGLENAQTEVAEGEFFLATDSVCYANEAVLRAMAQHEYSGSGFDLISCANASLAACGFPYGLGP